MNQMTLIGIPNRINEKSDDKAYVDLDFEDHYKLR